MRVGERWVDLYPVIATHFLAGESGGRVAKRFEGMTRNGALSIRRKLVARGTIPRCVPVVGTQRAGVIKGKYGVSLARAA